MSGRSLLGHFPAVFVRRRSLSSRWRLPRFHPWCLCGWRGEPRHTKAAALRQAKKHVEATQ